MDITPSTPSPTPTPRIGKFRASYMLTRQSFALLMKDKEILLFPTLSALFVLLLVIATGAAIFFFALQSEVSADTISTFAENPNAEYIRYIVLFFLYLISVFIATFFQAGLTAIVFGRIQGKDLHFRDGMNVAIAHIGKIFIWAVVSATVGIILRIVSDRSKTLGKIVVAILGATWAVVTLFIVPTLILEEGSVKDAIHRSAQTFKKIWGETFITNFSMGLMTMLIVLLACLPIIALIFMGNLTNILIGVAIFFIFLVGLSIVSSSLEAVFRVVLYNYATTGKIAEGFDATLVTGALKKS